MSNPTVPTKNNLGSPNSSTSANSYRSFPQSPVTQLQTSSSLPPLNSPTICSVQTTLSITSPQCNKETTTNNLNSTINTSNEVQALVISSSPTPESISAAKLASVSTNPQVITQLAPNSERQALSPGPSKLLATEKLSGEGQIQKRHHAVSRRLLPLSRPVRSNSLEKQLSSDENNTPRISISHRNQRGMIREVHPGPRETITHDNVPDAHANSTRFTSKRNSPSTPVIRHAPRYPAQVRQIPIPSLEDIPPTKLTPSRVTFNLSNSRPAASSKISIRPSPPPALFSLRRVHSDTSLHHSLPSLIPLRSRQALLCLPIRTRREPYDEALAGAFAAKLVSTINDAAICILISLGHQLGLFSVLSRLSSRPRSVGTIAAEARNLSPRYVQEWLLSLSCVGVIEETTNTSALGQVVRKYRLPPEHGVFLTWTKQSNLALLSQLIPILGRLQDTIISSFRSGLRIDGHRFAHFSSVASLDAVQTLGVDNGLRVLKHLPGLMEDLGNGAHVVCIGGFADGVYVRLAEQYPKSWFTCYSQCAATIKASREQVTVRGGGQNVHFRLLKGGLEEIVERNSFDAALILDAGPVRGAKRPIEVLRAVRRGLRKGGGMVMVETLAEGGCGLGDKKHPMGAWLYGMSTMQGLPCSDGDLGGVWGVKRAKESIENGGFSDVKVYELGDGFNCVLTGRAEVVDV